MKELIVSILLVALLFSCDNKTKEKATNEKSSKVITNREVDISEELKNGMPISDLKILFPNSTMEKTPAWEYGVDGGGDGYVIFKDSVKELFYWPHWEDPAVAGIIILNPKIKMKDGIHVGQTFKEYNSKYPNHKLQLDLISGFEYCYNKDLKYRVEFYTNDDNKLAEYEDMSSGDPGFSAQLRTDATINAISIEN